MNMTGYNRWKLLWYHRVSRHVYPTLNSSGCDRGDIDRLEWKSTCMGHGASEADVCPIPCSGRKHNVRYLKKQRSYVGKRGGDEFEVKCTR